jgi:hypothetical protein
LNCGRRRQHYYNFINVPLVIYIEKKVDPNDSDNKEELIADDDGYKEELLADDDDGYKTNSNFLALCELADGLELTNIQVPEPPDFRSFTHPSTFGPLPTETGARRDWARTYGTFTLHPNPLSFYLVDTTSSLVFFTADLVDLRDCIVTWEISLLQIFASEGEELRDSRRATVTKLAVNPIPMEEVD